MLQWLKCCKTAEEMLRAFDQAKNRLGSGEQPLEQRVQHDKENGIQEPAGDNYSLQIGVADVLREKSRLESEDLVN